MFRRYLLRARSVDWREKNRMFFDDLSSAGVKKCNVVRGMREKTKIPSGVRESTERKIFIIVQNEGTKRVKKKVI